MSDLAGASASCVFGSADSFSKPFCRADLALEPHKNLHSDRQQDGNSRVKPPKVKHGEACDREWCNTAAVRDDHVFHVIARPDCGWTAVNSNDPYSDKSYGSKAGLLGRQDW